MKEFYESYPKRLSAGRLHKRPSEVILCKSCKVPIGRNYISCERCYNAIESVWSADWKGLLEEEGIILGSEDEKLLAEVIVEDIDKHSWTIVDSAMKSIRCKNCGSELGGGPIDCIDCKFAFENLWAYDSEAINQGEMTYNEHALRVGRWVLRYPHRHKNNIVESWKFSMPIVLIGKLPTNEKAGFFKKIIDENKFDLSKKIYQSFEEAYLDVLSNTKR